mgnify:FL=1
MAIKLGGGGGSASSINEIIYLNNAQNKITFDDGRVYLKGGVVETDTTTYPLASKRPNSTSTTAWVPPGSIYGICVDSNFSTNGYYYVLFGTWSSQRLNKYNSSATLISSYNITAHHSTSEANGLCFADGFIYITGHGKTTKWSTSGVYQSQFSGSFEGITYDGSHFWVTTCSQIQKRTLLGVLVVSYDIPNGSKGIAFVDGDLWTNDGYIITQSSTQGEIKFTSATSVVTALGTSGTVGTDGTNLLITDGTNGVQQISFGIGVITDTVRTLALGTGQNYVRIA